MFSSLRMRSAYACVNFCLCSLTACIFTSLPAHAQAGLPDNQLSTLSPIGVPPGASTSGDNEQISLATGSLHISFPILALPQRGGWTLPLMYSYDSNMVHPVQSVAASSTVNTSDSRYGYSQDQRDYFETYVKLRNVLEPNLPRLQASKEFVGFFPHTSYSAATQRDFIIHCITNFVFTDWTGASHSFGNTLSCDNKATDSGALPQPVSVTDSLDGSFLRLDTTNSSDIVIYAKNGTQYHFTGLADPNANIPIGGLTESTYSQEDVIDSHEMHMVDVNGNTVRVTESQSSVDYSLIYTLVDTIGRTVIFNETGTSYFDSNGTSQKVSISAPTAGPALSSPVSYNNLGCYWNGTTGAYERTPTISSPTPQSSADTTQISITMPVGDASGHARQYTLQLDAAQHLVKVTYPSGGYTRYDFSNHNVTSWNGGVGCSTTDFFQVSAKHVCKASSGSCSVEDNTTYTPTNIVYGLQNNNSPYNGSIVVKDALLNASPADLAHGSMETHTFATQGYQQTSALETDLMIADGNGKPLRSTHTDYTPGVNFTELAFPVKTTVTLNDSPNGVKKVTNIKYGETTTVINYQNQALTVNLDNPTEIDELDFAAHAMTATSRTWKPATAFTVPHILDRLDAQVLVDNVAGTSERTVVGYDTLGNVTSRVRSGNDVPISQVTYGAYTNGYPASATDGRGNQTTYGYTDNFAAGSCVPAINTGAYVTSVILPNQAKTTFSYNACTGTIASSTDANGNTTTYRYDSLGRQTSASMPKGFGTSTTYTDAAPNIIQVTTAAAPDLDIVSATTLDGLGKTATTVTGGIEVDTTYDGDGRVSAVSNPAAGPGSDFTTSTYDALSRVIQITHPDTASTTTAYFGEVSIVQDEAGSTRVLTQNAQGLTASVCEVIGAMPSSGETPTACVAAPGQNLSGFTTSYSYNGRGNLTTVLARTQTRNFAYDTFNHLVTAQNPESGTICYGVWSGGKCVNGYDANGNLTARTDANGTTTAYYYDALNRMTQKTASDMNAYLFYDQGTNGIGRLTGHAKNGVSGEAYAYDAMGRTVATSWCKYLPGNGCQTQGGLQVQYDLAGNPTQLTYPDGRILTQHWDMAGRLGSVQDTTPNGSSEVYFSGASANAQNFAQYWPSGALRSAVYGNGVAESVTLNNRLQPCHSMASSSLLPAASSGVGNLWDRQSFYNPAANAPCSNEANNNGNIYAIVDNRQPGFTQSFTYDTLNRLHTAMRSDGRFNQTYTTDSFGNMTAQDTQSLIPQLSVLSNNRLDLNGTFQYDNAGHLTQVPDPLGGAHTFLYEAEGYLRCIDNCATGSYLNDALGQRAYESRRAYATWPVYLNRQVMTEYTDSGTITDYIYAGGNKIAKVTNTRPILHLHGVRDTSSNLNWGVEGRINGVPAAVQAYVIKPGDRLLMNYKQSLPTDGGLAIFFKDGRGSGPLTDIKTGVPLWFNQVGDGAWHQIAADLSNFQGTSIDYLLGGIHNSCPQGTFDMYYADVVLETVDGRTYPLLTGQPATVQNFSPDYSGGAHNLSSATEPTFLDDTSVATMYYLNDQVGTTQMEVTGKGWPVWQGQFTPFGQEVGMSYSLGPQPTDGTSMHFKFTGKERDQESGLDYFGARYYSSVIGRFTSPDWAANPEAVPYSRLDNPQSLNLYTYVLNNPLSKADPDGHCPACAVILEEAATEMEESPAAEAAGRALTGAVVATSAFVGDAIRSVYNQTAQDIHNVFSKSDSSAKAPPNPNGSKGAPDHQATADEEAAKMGPDGQREVRIPTPGGMKGTRVADAAKVGADGKPTEITQVIRPKKNGQPPTREVQAAKDLENATGIKPKLVSVRPLPNQ